MKYEGLPVYNCDVNENEWLDVKFSQEERIDGETKKLLNNEGKNQKLKSLMDKVGGFFKGRKDNGPAEDEKALENDGPVQRPYAGKPKGSGTESPLKSAVNKYGKAAAVILVILLLLVAMRFIDNGFAGNVFNYAKTTYTSTISKEDAKYTMTLPSSSAVTVNEEGDIIFSGGTIASCIESGTVSKITEDSITVKVNDHLSITYSGLSEILVQEGELVSKYSALGRYSETAIVSLTVDGQKITDVAIDDYTLTWSV